MTTKVSKKRKASRHVANIREILEEINHIDDFEDHADQAQSLVSQLKSKQRKSIIQSALTGHLQDEDLKPYQAELINKFEEVQKKLEQTMKQWETDSLALEKLN